MVTLMDIHNLTDEEKIEQRLNHLRLEFPNAYGVSLGEFPCIHRCRMCPMFSRPVKNTRLMSKEVFDRACDCLSDRSVQFEISAYGETFQHPEADDLLIRARKLCPNAEIIVATNGALLDRNRCNRIVDSGINHLSFSLDAGSAASHKWLTGTANYDLICQNLETLVDVRNRQNAKHLKITTHIIGIQELAHEFDDFLTRWSPVVDYAYVRNYGNWAGMVDSNGVTPAKNQVLPEERYPCAWLWYATKIEPNGDVSKCFIHVTGDSNPLGNIMEEKDFTAIWNGERMNSLRQAHTHNDTRNIEHCPNCNVWALFPHFWRYDANGVWI